MIVKIEDEDWLEKIKRANNKTGIPERAAKELSVFRLFTARQTQHDPRGDSLDACLTFNDQKELQNIIEILGVDGSLEPLEYKGHVDKIDPTLYQARNWPDSPIKKRGMVRLNGFLIEVRITKNNLLISTATEEPKYLSWEVKGDHIDNAKFIEKIIKTNNLNYVDPPLEYRNYLCPKYTPIFFS